MGVVFVEAIRFGKLNFKLFRIRQVLILFFFKWINAFHVYELRDEVVINDKHYFFQFHDFKGNGNVGSFGSEYGTNGRNGYFRSV